ncbi:MAG: hypothetical protein H7Y32_15055 [Chloroflexales bacterium]|nr:hypothetical protein [Chloroflexales bacterium]
MSGPKLLPRLLIALALSATGCGKFREISACRSVARDVNGALDEIETLSHAKPIDEARIAKRYATLAQTLQPRSLGETPLARVVRDYIAILQATDVALRNHAQAVKTQYGKVAEPRRELERLLKRERAAVVRIDVECQH